MTTPAITPQLYRFDTYEAALRFVSYLGMDTFADTFEEKHAFGWGVMAGMLTCVKDASFDQDGIPTEFQANKAEIMPEKHYFDLGKCIGRFMVDKTFRSALGMGWGVVRFELADRKERRAGHF